MATFHSFDLPPPPCFVGHQVGYARESAWWTAGDNFQKRMIAAIRWGCLHIALCGQPCRARLGPWWSWGPWGWKDFLCLTCGRNFRPIRASYIPIPLIGGPPVKGFFKRFFFFFLFQVSFLMCISIQGQTPFGWVSKHPVPVTFRGPNNLRSWMGNNGTECF